LAAAVLLAALTAAALTAAEKAEAEEARAKAAPRASPEEDYQVWEDAAEAHYAASNA
jgi:hypothetical protein